MLNFSELFHFLVVGISEGVVAKLVGVALLALLATQAIHIVFGGRSLMHHGTGLSIVHYKRSSGICAPLRKQCKKLPCQKK